MEVCKQSATTGAENERPEDAQDRIRVLEQRLAEAEHRRDTLEVSLIEARASLQDILSSRFWCYTAPARSLARMVRRILRPHQQWIGRAVQRARVVWRRARSQACFVRKALRHPPLFPAAPGVVVSIVIPTQNQCRATFACLRSIQEQTQRLDYEVIVVDDGSRDLTSLIVGSIKGLVYLRNSRPLGLIGSLTRGVSRARGNFLVFLRPDTTVTHRWLDELLETFTHFPETGLAGAKLLGAASRNTVTSGLLDIEECGRTADGPDELGDARDSFAREVEDCSTACAMVPTELFRTLSGLKIRSVPGPGKEIDLALPIRQKGRRVIYQPLSQVIACAAHSPEATPIHGSEVQPVVNLSNVRERELPLERILVIDETVPTHDKDAGSLRIFRLLSILKARLCHVTFIPDIHSSADHYTRDLQRIGVEVLYPPFVDSVEGFLKTHGMEYSLIWICRPALAFRLIDAAWTFAPSAKLVFDTIDLHFLRVSREADLKCDPALSQLADSLKQQELAIARKVDFTIVVSRDEKERLLEHAGPLDVRVVPTIHAVQPLVCPFQDRSGILFIGGFNHSPNLDAVAYFVSSIFPELRKTIPGVKFYVVGSNPPDTIRSLACEDIVVTGYVADVTDYFRNSRLSVAPLRYGAGVKGKVNMSMAYGLPAVISSIAAEGMHLVDGKNALIADDPPAFVAAVQRLYNSESLWTKLSVQGLKNIEEHFSFEAVSSEIDRLLYDAGLRFPSRPTTPSLRRSLLGAPSERRFCRGSTE